MPLPNFPTSDFSAEFQLILTCARPLPNARSEARQNALIEKGIDWMEVVNIARRHRVTPLVWQHLKQLSPESLPESARELLKKQALANVFKTMSQSRELCSLSKLMEKAGIDFILLKGPTTTHHGQSEHILRHARDMDIWVEPDKVDQAGRLLEQRGYKLVSLPENLSPMQTRATRWITNQAEYFHPDKNIILEIHWRLFHSPYRMPLTFSEAYHSCSEEMHIQRSQLRVLDCVHHIIFCCLHGAKHGWMRLKWIFDLPQLLDMLDEEAFEVLLSRARALKAETCVRETLIFCHQWFETLLPSSIILNKAEVRMYNRSYSIYRKMLSLEESPQRRLLLNNRVTINAYLLDDAKFGIMLHYLYSLIFRIKDFEYIRLPDSLFFMYIVIRPISLMKRLLSRSRPNE